MKRLYTRGHSSSDSTAVVTLPPRQTLMYRSRRLRKSPTEMRGSFGPQNALHRPHAERAIESSALPTIDRMSASFEPALALGVTGAVRISVERAFESTSSDAGLMPSFA